MYFPVKSSGLVRRTIGHVQAVDGISFQVPEGGSLGLVGESGCGKSTTGRLITRLYKPTGGSMMFEGHDLAKLSNREMKPLRRDVQMIFQDPYTSLNPRHTVGAIVGAPLVGAQHGAEEARSCRGSRSCSRWSASTPSTTTATPTSSPAASASASASPARSRSTPSCSSPTSRSPRSTCRSRRRSINLLQDLQTEFDIAFLFIAHDLAVVRHFCPEVAVMYLGKIVEIGDRETIYGHAAPPLHAGAALRGARREAGGDRRPPRADPARGRRAEPDQPAVGLPVPHPLPVRPGDLREGRAAAAADRPAPQGRLPLRRRARAAPGRRR